MKKTILFLLMMGMLFLSSCGKSTVATQTSSPETLTNTWDEATKLMVGTVLLETTNTPLTAEQESNLLLLWKGYKAVMASSTSSDKEIDALIQQIKGVLTAEQTAAIEAMGLTAETYQQKLSDTGLQVGMPDGERNTNSEQSGPPQMPMGGEMPADDQMPPSGNAQRSSSSSRQSSGGQMPSGGGMPGGMMAAGGRMSFGGDAAILGDTGASTLSLQATQQASMGLSNRTVNTFVLNAVIRYLSQAVNQ